MPDGICPFATRVLGVTTFLPGHSDRVGFCDHAAGGFFTTLASSSFWNNQGTSVHFGIGRKGEICQIINIFDRASAQGRDAAGNSVGPNSPNVTWPPFAVMNKGNPNDYLISTEHEDAEIVNGEVRFIAGSRWTEEQYQADLRVKRWCIEEVKRVMGKDLMRFGMDSLAGHHMFDPVNRNNCPGGFWQSEHKARLFADLQTTRPRVFLYGNEQAGLEVRGNRQVTWNRGVEVDILGDEAGLFPGEHWHNVGGTFVKILQ